MDIGRIPAHIHTEKQRVYLLLSSVILVLCYSVPVASASGESEVPKRQNPTAQEENFSKWAEESAEFMSQIQEGPLISLEDFQEEIARLDPNWTPDVVTKEPGEILHQVEEAISAFEEGKANLETHKYKEANAKLRDSAQRYELILKGLPTNTPLTAMICYNLGRTYMRLMEWERATETLFKAMDIQRLSGKEKDLANTYNSLGIVTLKKGDRETVTLYLEECVNLAKKAGSSQLEGAALGNLGLVYYLRGNMKKALQSYEAAIKIQQKLGNRPWEAKYLSNQGLIYQLQGKLGQALQAYNKALVINRETGNRKEEAGNLGNIGVIYNFQRRFEEALNSYNAALKIHRELGPRSEEAKDLGNIGIVYQSQGRLDDALSVHKESLQIHKVSGNLRGEAKDLNNIAVIYQTQGRLVEALAAYEEAHNLFLFLKSTIELEVVKQNIARIKDQLGEKKQ